MRSNYKRIGQFVRQVNNRNDGLAIVDLKGISINKLFMPSVANINGTDLSNYKVVSKHQFAYNPMHVGRDEVLPIGMLEADEPVIVSPAYVVFEIIDPEVLLPEYLMMWCRRPEFDRNCWFTTDSSVRGGFNWDDFCDMTLPVPHPNKQREIVREYNTIVERIKLNEQLIKKLEETAQALYKQWFVNFEFPISKEYAESIGKPELQGEPYLSVGGELKYHKKLDKYIPSDWSFHSFTDEIKLGGGGTPSTENTEYWGGKISFFTGRDVTKHYYSLETEKFITPLGLQRSSTKLYPKNTTFVVARGATTGVVALAGSEMAMNQSCYAIISSSEECLFAHQLTLDLMRQLKEKISSGAIFNALVTKDFDEQIVFSPPKNLKASFNRIVEPLYHLSETLLRTNYQLIDFNSLLLSRIATLIDA